MANQIPKQKSLLLKFRINFEEMVYNSEVLCMYRVNNTLSMIALKTFLLYSGYGK